MTRHGGISVFGPVSRCSKPGCNRPAPFGGECPECARQRARYHSGQQAPTGHGMPSADHYSFRAHQEEVARQWDVTPPAHPVSSRGVPSTPAPLDELTHSQHVTLHTLRASIPRDPRERQDVRTPHFPPDDETPKAKQARAQRFLRDELRTGDRDSRELRELANAQGISQASLYRARIALGVVSSRETFSGPARWTLRHRHE